MIFEMEPSRRFRAANCVLGQNPVGFRCAASIGRRRHAVQHQTENCTDLKMSGGAETMQFAALAVREPKLHPVPGGGGSRFLEIRAGADEVARG